MAAARTASFPAPSGSTTGRFSGSRISRWSKKGSGSRARSRVGGSFSSSRCSVEVSEMVDQSRPESGSLHSTA